MPTTNIFLAPSSYEIMRPQAPAAQEEEDWPQGRGLNPKAFDMAT